MNSHCVSFEASTGLDGEGTGFAAAGVGAVYVDAGVDAAGAGASSFPEAATDGTGMAKADSRRYLSVAVGSYLK